MTYIPDMTERFPDSGEPETEREYVINGWLPVMIEIRAYGSNKEEATEEAKRQLKQSDVKSKIVDHDLSELEVTDVEEV